MVGGTTAIDALSRPDRNVPEVEVIPARRRSGLKRRALLASASTEMSETKRLAFFVVAPAHLLVRVAGSALW